VYCETRRCDVDATVAVTCFFVCNITRTQDAMKKLYGKGVKLIIDGGAGKQEDALPVIQR